MSQDYFFYFYHIHIHDLKTSHGNIDIIVRKKNINHER